MLCCIYCSVPHPPALAPGLARRSHCCICTAGLSSLTLPAVQSAPPTAAPLAAPPLAIAETPLAVLVIPPVPAPAPVQQLQQQSPPAVPVPPPQQVLILPLPLHTCLRLLLRA